MKKVTYVATLASGHVIIRTSLRSYTHYWRVSASGGTKGFSGGDSGFARSHDLATKALGSAASRFRKHGGSDIQVSSEIVEVEIADKPRDDGTAIDPDGESGASNHG